MSVSEAPFTSSILDSVLSTELANCGSRAVTIHAGHYALFQNRQGDPVDRLRDPETDAASPRFVEFCRVTWEAACRSVAKSFPQTNAQLMVLVNDWQFVSRDSNLRRESEQLASRIRERYYLMTSTLPTYHLNAMECHGLSPDLILHCRGDRWLFSESALRSDLRPLIRDILSDERWAVSTGVRRHFSEDGEPIIDVCDSESGNVRLLYCGNTNCAGEVVALLRNLHVRGIRCFLNTYPSVCREPVNKGTSLAYRLFGLDGMVVTNIAVSGATVNGTDLDVAVEHFSWEDFSH